MRLLLVNPTRFGGLEPFHLGMASLHAVIEAGGRHRAFVCDFIFSRGDWKGELRRAAARHRPDLVGITTYSPFMPGILEIGEYAKRALGLPVLYGGHHATLAAEETLAHPSADWLVVGEGEEALPDLLDALEEGRSPEGLAGICGKRPDGTRFLSGPRVAAGSLDPYPPADWSAWPGFEKFVYFVGMIPIQGARGCLYDCAFCSSSAMKNALRGGYYRTRSPERVVEEAARNARRFREHGARYAWFWDLNFLYDRPWLEGFREAWPKADLRLPISVFSRPDHVTEETADILRELGCFQVRMGIESGDEALRNRIYDKDLSDEQVRRAARLLRKRGIRVLGYYILGGPGETWGTLGKTLRMAAAIRTDRPAFFVFKPMTGTRAASLVGEMEIPLDPDRIGRNSDILSKALLDNPGLPARWVDRVQGAANAVFGLQILLRQLRGQGFAWFARLAAYWRRARAEGLSAKDALMTFFLFGYENYRS